MRLWDVQRVQRRFQVVRKQAEGKPARARLGFAVPPAVHRQHPETHAYQNRNLVFPVAAVLAVAVQKHDGNASARFVTTDLRILTIDKMCFLIHFHRSSRHFKIC